MRPHLRILNALLRMGGWQTNRLSRGDVLIHRGESSADDLTQELEAFLGLAHLQRILTRLGIELVLDAGAHEGGYGKRLRSVGYIGKIVSFEPNPDAFAVLSRLSSVDPSWDVHRLAVGAEAGTVALRIAKDSQFSSVNRKSAVGDQFGQMMDTVRVIEVPMDSLDAFMARTRLPIQPDRTLLKVDTQGFDHTVFGGATELLKTIRAVMFELPLLALYEDVQPYAETLRMLENYGFGIYAIAPIAREAVTECIMEADVLLVRRTQRIVLQ